MSQWVYSLLTIKLELAYLLVSLCYAQWLARKHRGDWALSWLYTSAAAQLVLALVVGDPVLGTISALATFGVYRALGGESGPQ